MRNICLFDIEGTLVDSVSLTLRSWQDALDAFGLSVDPTVLQACSGMDGGDLLSRILPTQSEFERQAVRELQGKLFEDRYLHEVRPFPHVRTTLEQLKDSNHAIALATDCKGATLAYYRKLLQIDGLLHAISCGDEVVEGKPNPALLTHALQRLDARPTDAVLVGDTPYDALAAVAAGMACIGTLTGGFAPEDLRRAGCLQTVPSLVHVPAALKAIEAEAAAKSGT